jgi:hypothetical protein
MICTVLYNWFRQKCGYRTEEESVITVEESPTEADDNGFVQISV